MARAPIKRFTVNKDHDWKPIDSITRSSCKEKRKYFVSLRVVLDASINTIMQKSMAMAGCKDFLASQNFKTIRFSYQRHINLYAHLPLHLNTPNIQEDSTNISVQKAKA